MSAPPEANRYPLKIRHIAGWSCGGFGLAVYLGITINYFLFFLTEGANIGPAMASLVLLLPRLWDVITDPLMGAISDRTPGKQGRRRPWILWGGLFFSISFYMMFSIPDFELEWQRALWVTGFYLLVGTGYTMFEVPLNAMMPELSQDFKERGRLATYNMLAIRTGLIGTMLIGPFIFAGSGDDLAIGFRSVGLFAAIIIAASSIIVYVTTADAPRIERRPTPFSLKNELRAIYNNREFRVLFLAHLSKFTGIGAAATSVIYFMVFVLKTSEQTAGVLLSISAATATLFLPFWMFVMSRIGKKQAYSVALAVLSCAMLLLLLIDPDMAEKVVKIPYLTESINGAVFAVALVLIAVSLGDSGAILVPNAMVPDTVEADELNTGTRREGTILGAWTFSRKLGMALGAFIVSMGLSFFGFAAGVEEQTARALLGIKMIYIIFPTVFYILALLILQKYTLTEDRFRQIKDTLLSNDLQPSSSPITQDKIR